MWRIDYVFHSTDMVAVSATTGDYGGSDHRPVIAKLDFRVSD
jgi:endonuclease/exonuclease/phosphatase (EEP) superfamily protein YafD